MKSLFLILGLILLISTAVYSRDITTKEVIYDTEKNIKGFMAEPSKPSKYPGIILIHEWWGLNDYIKDRAKDLAALGYVVLAVDMYEGKLAETPDDARKFSGEARQNAENSLKNLEKAIAFIKTQTNIDPANVASLGFCFGGAWSYQIAKNNMGTKVSVIYYGTINPKDDLTNLKTIILGNFGEKDASIKAETVKEFQTVLKTQNKKHEIYIYAGAAHAFDNPKGANYNKEASDTAWKRTVAFLKKHLK